MYTQILQVFAGVLHILGPPTESELDKCYMCNCLLCTWLTTFKLLQLVFGYGSISDPSLAPSSPFCLNFLFPDQNPPTKISPIFLSGQRRKPSKENSRQREFRGIACFFIFLITVVASHEDNLPRKIALFLICLYIYVGLEIFLGITTNICQILLGIKFESPFNESYLSTSFQDFLRHRWNGVSASVLRSTVFDPPSSAAYGFPDTKRRRRLWPCWWLHFLYHP
ncbi:acyl-CoA--sterol O-acyltransferase 1-like [Primulina huaijiensis]|uniref:acyl-CoA--sterol O-acyltransferase 1-like n=1 Tax=Primulina huaijiensis TaxID=1492673 RepID=UPI003CC78FBD